MSGDKIFERLLQIGPVTTKPSHVWYTDFLSMLYLILHERQFIASSWTNLTASAFFPMKWSRDFRLAEFEYDASPGYPILREQAKTGINYDRRLLNENLDSWWKGRYTAFG